MTIIKNTNNNSNNNRITDSIEDLDKRQPHIYCCWEGKLIQPLWKSVWRFLKKLKTELPYDPAATLLEIYPKDTRQKYLHLNVYDCAGHRS